jgi:hypothetical protein
LAIVRNCLEPRNSSPPHAVGLKQSGALTMAKSSKDEIIALEKDYWDAMKRKDGARRL